jgi:ubiquinol-cytochrome c reductase cytochrome b subunit
VYGPFRPADVSAASQPDWYMGWLDGGLRIMPPWEIRFAGFEIPNPFFPGVLLPTIVFGLLFLAPWIEEHFTKDRREHHVLQRPRDHPLRTALGVGGLALYLVMLGAASSDVIASLFGLSVNVVIWIFRISFFAVPVIVGILTDKICRELQLRDGPGLPPGEPPVASEPLAPDASSTELISAE